LLCQHIFYNTSVKFAGMTKYGEYLKVASIRQDLYILHQVLNAWHWQTR